MRNSMKLVIALSMGVLAGTIGVSSGGYVDSAVADDSADGNGKSPSSAALPRPIQMRMLFDTAKQCPQFSGLLTEHSGLVTLLVPGTLGYKQLSAMPGQSLNSIEFQLGTDDCKLEIEIRHRSKRGDRMSLDPIKLGP